MRILALLESDNDAEALQALRTAQRLLGQSGLSFSEIAAEHSKLASLSVGASQRNRRHVDDREILVLRAELQRFRALYDQVCREKVSADTEIERLKSFLKSNQSLPLFQRLRDREENVRALTREVGRLRDELFVQERRTRELERQLALASSATAARRTTRRQAQDSDARGGSGQANEHEVVKCWAQRAGLSLSTEQTDWVSLRRLFRLFQQEHLVLRDGRIVEVWGEDNRPPRLTQARFSALLREALGAGMTDKSPLGARSGFCIVSNLDLSEGAQERAPSARAHAGAAREHAKKRAS